LTTPTALNLSSCSLSSLSLVWARFASCGLLRLCLASYRIKRSIGIEGVYSKTVVATRGITAGSGTATTELKLLLSPLMRMLKQQWANTLIAKVYVDDLTLIMRGLVGAVVKGWPTS